jgi:hypothetical protein
MYLGFRECSLGVQGKDEFDIKNKVDEAKACLEEHFGGAVSLLVWKGKTYGPSSTEIVRYTSWGDETDDVFDVGDRVFAEDYDAVGEIVSTSDYDGDVDDEGRSIGIEASVMIHFQDDKYGSFYDKAYISAIEKVEQ